MRTFGNPDFRLNPDYLGSPRFDERRDRAADPFSSLLAELCRVYEEMWNRKPPATGPEPKPSFPLFVDLKEDDGAYYIDADLSGVKEESVDIVYQDGLVTISGEKTEEADAGSSNVTWLLRERPYGVFSRNIPLPCKIAADRIEAKCCDGLLKVVLPKTSPSECAAFKHGPVRVV